MLTTTSEILVASLCAFHYSKVTHWFRLMLVPNVHSISFIHRYIDHENSVQIVSTNHARYTLPNLDNVFILQCTHQFFGKIMLNNTLTFPIPITSYLTVHWTSVSLGEQIDQEIVRACTPRYLPAQISICAPKKSLIELPFLTFTLAHLCQH